MSGPQRLAESWGLDIIALPDLTQLDTFSMVHVSRAFGLSIGPLRSEGQALLRVLGETSTSLFLPTMYLCKHPFQKEMILIIS